MLRPAWLLQQIVPPLALTYFFVCWRICTFELGPRYITQLFGQTIGYTYSGFATCAISTLALLYLRLYFLPKTQSAPPFNPPVTIRGGQVIYECLSPAESDAVLRSRRELIGPNETTRLSTETSTGGIGLINRCHRDQCQGRWKPARARHCSLCGTCRAGFDHHCAIFANCLTAPYIPHFLSLLVCAPPTILLLGSPLLLPLATRARAAWEIACQDEYIRRRWWDWKASWIVAGGPMGRWAGGLILGWKVLDREDKREEVRLQIGVLVFLGLVFSAICIGLAVATISVIRAGHLTVDRERARSHFRARLAISTLQRAGKAVPQALIDEMERYADRRWFFVPMSGHVDGGAVLPTLPDERAYDHGARKNWEIVMGEGWSWALPWRAARMGMRIEEVVNWPINEEVERRLRREAARVVQEQEQPK